jgi:hypothetical protein
VAYYPYLCAFTVCVNCRSVALLALRTFSNASRACKLKARMSLSAFHVYRRMQLWIACATGMDRNIHLGELRRAPWNNRPGDPFELAPPQRSSPRCNRPSPRRDDRQFLGHNRRSAIGGGASAAGWFAAIRKLASENCSSHCQRMSLPDPQQPSTWHDVNGGFQSAADVSVLRRLVAPPRCAGQGQFVPRWYPPARRSGVTRAPAPRAGRAGGAFA